jgi:hypothetical protein
VTLVGVAGTAGAGTGVETGAETGTGTDGLEIT